MKRLLFLFLTVCLMLPLSGCGEPTQMTQVRLNEVVHSIFYAPMYVAIEKGFFGEEGLAIELSTGQGADAHAA